MPLAAVTPDDVPALRVFLAGSDLTLAGLDDPAVRLWIDRSDGGAIVGSTGFELSTDGAHALLRSVAVAADRREAGAGSRLATHALTEATEAGGTRAWLFSRRSGAFWQKLGFDSADRSALADTFPDSHQVRLFIASGQLEREVAWARHLDRRRIGADGEERAHERPDTRHNPRRVQPSTDIVRS